MPSQMEPVERIDTLRGLNGVYADLRGTRGPAAFKGRFGADAQTFLEKVFARYGIPLLTKEEASALPGNPTLVLRFSVEVNGCRPWSVTLSLNQRVLLARDLTKMFETTTWSARAGQLETDVNFVEDHAMEQVILAFAQAYHAANYPDRPPLDISAFDRTKPRN